MLIDYFFPTVGSKTKHQHNEWAGTYPGQQAYSSSDGINLGTQMTINVPSWGRTHGGQWSWRWEFPKGRFNPGRKQRSEATFLHDTVTAGESLQPCRIWPAHPCVRATSKLWLEYLVHSHCSSSFLETEYWFHRNIILYFTII